MKIALYIILFLFFCVNISYAQTTSYYASIKADEANIRTGPSVKYPIRWVYKKSNWPVQIIASFESWRKVVDIYGEAGWIHESLLTGRRNALIKSKEVQEVYKLPLTNASVEFIAENGVVVRLLECRKDWCKVRFNNEKGWIQTSNLWGVDSSENFE